MPKTNELAIVVGDSWIKVLEGQRSPVLSYLLILHEQGVNIKVLCRLIDVLFALGVDVADPHSASSELSIIIGYLSQKLLGTDLSRFRFMVDQIEHNDLLINHIEYQPLIAPDIVDASFKELKEAYNYLRSQQRQLILSPNIYKAIAREITLSSNRFVRTLLQRLLFSAWKELGIAESSQAVLFFRNMKTYAADLDLFYWGPMPDAVIELLTRPLIILGFKVDHWAYMTLQSIIKRRNATANSFLAGTFYIYFHFGQIIEIGGEQFGKYQDDLLSQIDMNELWQKLDPYFNHLLSSWERESIDVPLKSAKFKEVQFRSIELLILRLCRRYNQRAEPDLSKVLDALNNHLEASEILAIEDAMAFITQARNLYQLTSRRRWEMIDERTLSTIAMVLFSQGVSNFQKLTIETAGAMRAIAQKHIGAPGGVSPDSFLADEASAAPQLAADYQRVAQFYLNLINKSQFVCFPD